MHISSLGKAKKIKPNMEGAEGVYKQVPISREDGTPTFSFRVFKIEPGGHTPFHAHPFEHINYVFEGSGVVIVKDQEYEIKKATSFWSCPMRRINTGTYQPPCLWSSFVQSLKNMSKLFLDLTLNGQVGRIL